MFDTSYYMNSVTPSGNGLHGSSEPIRTMYSFLCRAHVIRIVPVEKSHRYRPTIPKRPSSPGEALRDYTRKLAKEARFSPQTVLLDPTFPTLP